MKKIVNIILICFILCACNNKNITKEIKKIPFKAEIQVSKVTSNSVTFKVESNEENLEFKLFDGEAEVINGNVIEEVTLTDLKESTEYELKVFNDNGEIGEHFTTTKITKLTFAGDVLMDLYFANYIRNYGVDYPLAQVKDLITSADIAMLNLETSVSERGTTTKSEGYGFRSKPNTLEGLVNAGIDIVSVANNHIADYGYVSFEDTLENLKKYNIKYVGGGYNFEEALEPQYIEVNDLKIAYMAATSIIPYNSWIATNEKGGFLPFTEKYYEIIFNKIKEVKKNCDYLVFNLHWGTEYNNYPSDTQVELAHGLIDNGVDILVGHHPHVLQGIEYYKNGIIYYSLGNFSFLIKNDNASHSGLFELNLDKNGIVSSRIYPTTINYCRANLLSKEDKTYNLIIENLNERSNKFGTKITENGFIEKNKS